MRRAILLLSIAALMGLSAWWCVPRLIRMQQNHHPFLFNIYNDQHKSGLATGFQWLNVRPMWITWVDIQVKGVPGVHVCAQIGWDSTIFIDHCPWY